MCRHQEGLDSSNQELLSGHVLEIKVEIYFLIILHNVCVYKKWKSNIVKVKD